MRVMLFHPWGRFGALCGASHTARALLDYGHARGWRTECVMQEIPSWGVTADDEARAVRVECPPVAPGDYGAEFSAMLYASERAAGGRGFRHLAAEPWDAFLTTDVCAAPFAHALPAGVCKVLCAGDSYARRAATRESAAPSAREAEQTFAFARVEAELYQLFDLVLFGSAEDAARARRHGVTHARHVPVWVREPAPFGAAAEEHDITVCGGERSGDLEDLEWFYRHVYLPHLRACGVRFTVAGPVAARFAVNDLRLTKLPHTDGVYRTSRLVVAPFHESAGPCAPVLEAMAEGRAVLATPLALRGLDAPAGAVVKIDMRADPAGTAAAIRALLASPAWRAELGARAAQRPATHSGDRFFAALDAAWPALTEVA